MYFVNNIFNFLDVKSVGLVYFDITCDVLKNDN